MDFYFVYCGKSSIETEVIRELKPPRLLLSHFYYKHRDLEAELDKIGYRPEIFYDSGAFSAFNKGKKITLEGYMSDLERKMPFISRYMAFDTLGDNHETFSAYAAMKKAGFNPVPVYQYERGNDFYYLEQYIEQGEKTIALGGTVPIRNRNEVRDWVKLLCWTYPEVDFHLLGTGAKDIIDSCDLASADASSWILGAAFGRPRHIKGKSPDKVKQRAIYNMKQLLHIPGGGEDWMQEGLNLI